MSGSKGKFNYFYEFVEKDKKKEYIEPEFIREREAFMYIISRISLLNALSIIFLQCWNIASEQNIKIMIFCLLTTTAAYIVNTAFSSLFVYKLTNNLYFFIFHIIMIFRSDHIMGESITQIRGLYFTVIGTIMIYLFLNVHAIPFFSTLAITQYSIRLIYSDTNVEDYYVDHIFCLFVYCYAFLFKKKYQDFILLLKERDNANDNLKNFYNKILNRSINYFFIVFSNNSSIFMNKTCEDFLVNSLSEAMSSKTMNQTELINYFFENLELVNPKKLHGVKSKTSLNSYIHKINDVQGERESIDRVSEPREDIVIHDEFQFHSYYFEVFVMRSRTLLNNEDVYEIELYNITNSKAAETQVREEVAKKQKFLSRVAHEFKTPLLGIISLCNKVEENYKRSISILGELEQIDCISNYIIFLVNDFIQISKKNTELNIDLKPVSLESILHFSFKILKTLLSVVAKDRNVDPQIFVDEKIKSLVVISDELRLKQMLLNFLSNSVKFTNYGNITLNCVVEERNEMLFEKSESCLKYGVIIMVTDTGTGIHSEQLKVIKSHQFDEIVVDKIGNQLGTGLGLSITHILADKLGINLVIDSEYGKGTQVILNFTKGITKKVTTTLSEISSGDSDTKLLNLELMEDQSFFLSPFLERLLDFVQTHETSLTIPCRSTLNPAFVGISSKREILVVDDNTLIRTSLINNINKYLVNYSLDSYVTVVSGSDGIDIVKSVIADQHKGNKIDLIFSDLIMEFLNGDEAVSILMRLEKEGKMKRLPAFVCFTALDDEDSKEKLMAQGFNLVVNKEVQLDKLEPILNKYLSKN